MDCLFKLWITKFFKIRKWPSLEVMFSHSRCSLRKEKILPPPTLPSSVIPDFGKFLWPNLYSTCYHVSQIRITFPASFPTPSSAPAFFLPILTPWLPPLFRASDPLPLYRIQDYKSYKSCQLIIQCPLFTDVETKAQREYLPYSQWVTEAGPESGLFPIWLYFHTGLESWRTELCVDLSASRPSPQTLG